MTAPRHSCGARAGLALGTRKRKDPNGNQHEYAERWAGGAG